MVVGAFGAIQVVGLVVVVLLVGYLLMSRKQNVRR